MTNRGRVTWEHRVVDQVQENGSFLFRLAHKVLRDPAAAEDACQQAFVKALEGEAAIREVGSLRSWLAKVVVNESLQILRKRASETRHLPERARIGASEAVSAVDLLADRDEVRLALGQLREPTRTVVVLRVMQGMSGNEVKDMLGCSASEVSRRLHEGLDELRMLLQDCAATATSGK